MTRPKRTIAAALATLLVLGGLGNAHGVVLCLADDGHAQFEFAWEEGCSDFVPAESGAARRVGQQLNAPPADASHCGACVDLPIGLGDPARPQNLVLQNSNSFVKAPVAVVSGFSFPPAACATRQCAAGAHPVGCEALASLRAAVLLI